VTSPLDSSYREILLTLGKVAIVDTDNFARLSAFKWHARLDRKTGKFYAVRCIGRSRKVYMHREVMNAGPGELVDHRRIMETLVNTRENLRLATKSQNNHHQRLNVSNSTGYMGVSLHANGQYQARISVNGTQKHLGYRKRADEAAIIYDEAARYYYGEFAHQNFPNTRAPEEAPV
jgi:hypothetical protein